MSSDTFSMPPPQPDEAQKPKRGCPLGSKNKPKDKNAPKIQRKPKQGRKLATTGEDGPAPSVGTTEEAAMEVVVEAAVEAVPAENGVQAKRARKRRRETNDAIQDEIASEKLAETEARVRRVVSEDVPQLVIAEFFRHVFEVDALAKGKGAQQHIRDDSGFSEGVDVSNGAATWTPTDPDNLMNMDPPEAVFSAGTAATSASAGLTGPTVAEYANMGDDCAHIPTSLVNMMYTGGSLPTWDNSGGTSGRGTSSGGTSHGSGGYGGTSYGGTGYGGTGYGGTGYGGTSFAGDVPSTSSFDRESMSNAMEQTDLASRGYGGGGTSGGGLSGPSWMFPPPSY